MERLGYGAGEGEVAALELASNPEPDPLTGVLGGDDHLGAASGGGPLGQIAHRLGDPPEDQRRVIAEHGKLLGGDLLLGLTEPLGVVEADRGQGGHPRGDRVGRVEPPPQPGLDHPDADPGRGEGDEPGCGRDLELGHRFAAAASDDLGRLGSALDRGRELGRSDLGAADHDPLRPAVEMRRDHRAGGDPMGFEQRRGHPRHRGLAVGADHMDRGEAMLGHPQQRVQTVHPLEPEPPPDRLERVEVGLGALRGLFGQLLQLGAVAVELLALLLDHLGRGVGDEALVGEFALRPADLAAELLASRLDPGAHRLGVDLIRCQDPDRAD